MTNPLFFLKNVKSTSSWFLSQIAEVIIFAVIYYMLEIIEPNKHFTNIKCIHGKPCHPPIINFIWFSLCIQSTLGYGDIMPKSQLAKIINMIQIFLVYAGIANAII